MNPKQRLRSWQRQGIKIESYQQYLDLFNSVGGICQIDKTALSPGGDPEHATACLDHDHETGEMRGILCSIHNYDLWKLDQYGIEELEGLAEYIVTVMIPMKRQKGSSQGGRKK